MALTPFKKIGILSLRDEVCRVLSALQKMKNFEVIGKDRESDFIPESFQGIESQQANLDFLYSYLRSSALAPKNLREKVLGEQVICDLSQAEIASSQDFSSLLESCSGLEKEEGDIKSTLDRGEEVKGILEQWEEVNFPLSDIQDTECTHVFLGRIDAKDASDFEHALQKISSVSLDIVSQGRKHAYLLLIAHRDSTDEVQKILAEFRFTASEATDNLGTPSEELRLLAHKKEVALMRLLEIDAQKKEYAQEYITNIKLALDAFSWKQEQKSAYLRGTQTKKTVLIEGWIPVADEAAIIQSLVRVTPNAALIDLEEEKEEEAPVQLNNKKAKPFEIVLGLFGTPKQGEVDPTPFMAPFFVIFFGFCLTDAGYGIVLTLTLLWVMKALPLSSDNREMVKLLLYGGISTTILGVLFGGYFGMTPEQFSLLANPETGQFYGQILNPVDDLVPKIMMLAYGLGVAHLLLGVVLGGINRWRKEEKRAALLGSGSLVLILATALSATLSSAIATIALPLILLLVVFLIIGLMPSSGNIFGRILLGVLGVLDEAITWLSNVLSYSRLFALGLATGVIALAFNSIAITVGGMMPLFIGIPIALLIILFGHSLNMGLNLLGAFVHSGRLQFVEFFGKFFEGGGRPFAPLSQKTRFIFEEAKK